MESPSSGVSSSVPPSSPCAGESAALSALWVLELAAHVFPNSKEMANAVVALMAAARIDALSLFALVGQVPDAIMELKSDISNLKITGVQKAMLSAKLPELIAVATKMEAAANAPTGVAPAAIAQQQAAWTVCINKIKIWAPDALRPDAPEQTHLLFTEEKVNAWAPFVEKSGDQYLRCPLCDNKNKISCNTSVYNVLHHFEGDHSNVFKATLTPKTRKRKGSELSPAQSSSPDEHKITEDFTSKVLNFSEAPATK